LKARVWIFMAVTGLCMVLCELSYAEVLSDRVGMHIRERIEAATLTSDRILCADETYCVSALLEGFYTGRQYRPCWVDNDGNLLTHGEEFIGVIREAHREGLRPEDYHLRETEVLLSELKRGKGVGKRSDTITLTDLDLTLTDALLLYTRHLLHGRVEHQNVYTEEVVTLRTLEMASSFYTALMSGERGDTLADLISRPSGYEKLREKLEDYMSVAGYGGWSQIPPGPTLKRGSQGQRVAQLRDRLIVSGDLDTVAEHHPDVFGKALEEGVRRFQKRHGLKVDGKVAKETLDILNIPVETRIRQMALNMDRLRWLPDDLGKRHIFVNIADFRLEVVEDDRQVMTMKIIVGKKDQPSCMLSGKMVYLELNPFWKIPDGIAIKEILPQIKKNPEYLAEKSIKLLRDWNDNAKEIDPKTVDWSRMRENNFRYRLRQEPGSLNPLGRVKFIFPNECEIYLHDTPGRHLFGRQRRDFSHGCIRIEKPMDMAVYLLRDRQGWTRKKILAEIGKGKRQVVTLSGPFDVHITYLTAWVDRSGILQFRSDIYRIDQIPYELPVKPVTAFTGIPQ